MTTTDQALATLRQRWGTRWEIWYVPLAIGGTTWCAAATTTTAAYCTGTHPTN